MKVLITGGFGFLGGRLAQLLAAGSKHQVLLASRQRRPPPDWLPAARPVQIHWDRTDTVDTAVAGADAVVSLAGMNAEDAASDAVGALECNGIGTGRVLEAAKRQRVKRFVYLSTAHVYGSPLSGVITEQTCPVSLHPYATSHRAGEDLVRAAHQRKEIEGVVVRLSNSFGAPAHKGANCWMLLVNDLCRQAVATGRLVLRSDGLQHRDFVALSDACRAISHLLELPVAALADGLFNVGGGWSPSVLEMTERVAERVFAITGRRPPIERGKEGNRQQPASLDYSVDKLAATGFSMDCNAQVDQEIDRLIRFCLENYGPRK